MAHLIVEISPASRFSSAASTLNRDVWEHEARAKQQGLQPVVEVYSAKSKLSARVSKIWSDDPALTADTLDGIYLIRIDLKKHGAKAVLGLTPRTAMGVPLFVSWTRLGQSLSRLQLNRFEETELELPLSAFFEDVVAERAFRFEASAKSTLETRPEATATPIKQAPNAHVIQLQQQLQPYIEKAHALAVQSLAARQLLTDVSLESLSELDVLLAEDSELRSGSPQAQQLIAALAVYFGETIRIYAQASWTVDTTQPTLVRALRLRGGSAPNSWDIAPGVLLLAAMEDPSAGLLGSAAKLAGLLSDEE